MLERITAQTTSGPVVGRSKEDVYLFAGIPYAAAPVDELRFKPPQPREPWSEPFQALKFGPAAPQVPGGGLTDSASVRWSEDCLSLNVSTPACDDGKRAVLVWIHGGGYRTGQGSIPWYNGARFSRHGDIVVVSINYRLGALGFTDLSHLGPDYALSSVCGTLDQIAALQWVQQNIGAFGGDPERVTIAGESAGGFSVSTLLGCPSAQGLFQRVIAQSGGAQHTLPKAASTQVTERFLSELDLDTSAGLATAPVETILAAQNQTITYFESNNGAQNTLGVAVSPFYPAHENGLLAQSPLQNIREGCGQSVALLTGSNTHETTLWGYGKIDSEKLQRIAESYGATEVLETYRRQRPNADIEELLIALTTDHMFRMPALRLAEARQAQSPDNWLYQFNWSSRAFDGRLKATHALEIPFAFNNLDRAGVDVFIGPGATPQGLANTMHEAWTQFINDGDPGWPRYRLPTRATMFFDETSRVIDNPGAAERQAWDGVR